MKSAPSPTSRSDGAGPRSSRALPPRPPASRVRRRAGFTLVEILASLLMMAIVVPVAMEGMGIASRAGLLGQRKAAAMRVAERLLEELVAEGNNRQSADSGTLADGEFSYPWTARTENWSEDALRQLTVTVTFTLQGNRYDVSVATLLPPDGTGTLPAL